MEALRRMVPESRKLRVFVLSAVLFVLNELAGAWLGVKIPDDHMDKLIELAMVWIVGQGIADHGTQGAVIAAHRLVGKSAETVAAVRDALRVQVVAPQAPRTVDVSDLRVGDQPRVDEPR